MSARREESSSRPWVVVAAACVVAAVALWLVVGVEAAFVVATLGAVAWLWDQRGRIAAGVAERAGDSEGEGVEELEEADGEGGRGVGG